jgi:oligopeptide transport system substrate-binding protein
MRKILRYSPFLIALVAVAAVACGGGKTEGLTVTQEVQTEVPAVEPTEVVEAVQPADSIVKPAEVQPVERAAVSEKSGGIFRLLGSDPPTLDPHLTTDTTSAFYVVEIFSGLVSLDTSLQLIPDIAESWQISPDGLVYTFTLRPDVKFHDGKPVTAKDFKWSIERAADPDTGSPVADTYLGDIVGVKEKLAKEAAEIRGLKVIDDYTLQFTIDAPKAYFLAKLTYPTAYVLDQENVEAGGSTWTDTPNGTGTFKLKEYKIGERIVLERNDSFYRDLAYLDSIVLNLAGGQSMAMYENDEIDITGVSLFDLERVLDPNDEMNKQLIVAPPSFSVSYIGFNTNWPPFDDINFRQALNHAVDKDLIAKEVLSDLVEPAYGVLPPGFPGFNPSLTGLRFDPELAKRLLAESQYADDIPRIELTVPGTGGTIGLDLEVVLEMWRSTLGVEVEIVQVEWATYLQDLQENKFQAFAGLGWEADYPDPQDFLDILFHTDSEINHGAYSNLEADRILELARVETDIVKRVALYQEAEDMIVNDGAWVPLWFTGDRYVLVKPHVKGYHVTPMIVPKLGQIHLES